MNIFPKKTPSKADDFCPILALWPNAKTTQTKGGKFARVIELAGKDYSGLAPEIIESFFEIRKSFFEGIDPELTVLQHSHRRKVANSIGANEFENPMAETISEVWDQQFQNSYRTSHYLIFVTDPDITDQIQLLVKNRDKGENRQDELLRKLDDCVQDTLVRLEAYGPKELSGDALASYWATLLNGKEVYQKAPENGVLDGLLSGTSLKWPMRSRYQIYESDKERFSGWLYIKMPARETNHQLLEKLFELKIELSIYQTIAMVSKSAAMRFLADKERNVSAFVKDPEIIQLELAAVKQDVQADNISIMSHRWAIEVFGGSKEDLEDHITVVKNAIESFGYRTVRERINQEALFWSRFPEYQKLNCRQRFPTSENVPHFASFANVGEGHSKCSWGPAPVTKFKTRSSSDHSFIFHISPEKSVLGNTLVIGGTGSGKTALTSFLLSQSFKFPNFRVLAFDRLAGMKIFTAMHDGEYQNFGAKSMPIAPLQLNDTAANRAFLGQWFQLLTGKGDEQSLHTISNAIANIFELDKKERTLSNVSDAFGLKDPGSIRAALGRWLPGGAYESFFNGKKDALSFENRLVTFDMTALLDNPDILGPMAYYLFHKLFLSARDDGGYAVFVDELGKYLNSEIFAPKIAMMLEEIRKTNGVFIGAIQEAGTVLDHAIAPKIKNNIGTYILFPEPRAEKKHYIEELRLNQTEYDWIKKPHHRQVLVKRRDGQSVVLNIDLKPLGPLLRVFDSSSDAIREMENIRKKKDDWKKGFLVRSAGV